MSQNEHLAPLLVVLHDLVAWLGANQTPCVIIGGVAASVDIESILDANPNLNLERIQMWVQEFSSILEMPEILNDLEAILSRKRKNR